jgi:hypothetical protein
MREPAADQPVFYYSLDETCKTHEYFVKGGAYFDNLVMDFAQVELWLRPDWYWQDPVSVQCSVFREQKRFAQH